MNQSCMGGLRARQMLRQKFFECGSHTGQCFIGGLAAKGTIEEQDVLRRQYNRIYAELRWQVNKKQHSQYLREVTDDTRAANLAAAWQRAHDLGLTTTGSTANHSVAIIQE